MSTIEKLFVQIFERKRWIVDQVKQQSDLYDQFLASNCLINGIRPPSWLLTSGFDGAGSAEVKELKREDLISGLFFPPARPNQQPHNALCNKLPFSGNIVQDSAILCTGASASQNYFDVGHNSMVVSKFHLDDRKLDTGASVGAVPELNNDVRSPLDQMEARMSDSNVQLDQSLIKIQRSRSRQKALEIRKSGEAKSEKQPNIRSGLKSVDNLLPHLDSVKENKDHNILDNQALSQSSNLVQMENMMEANREKKSSSRIILDDCAQGILQTYKSDEISRGRVAHSRRTSRNEYSQPDTQLNILEGYGFLQASDTKSIGMLGGDGNGDTQLDNAVDAENDFGPRLPNEKHSNDLLSNTEDGLGKVEFSVLDSPLNDDIYVEPKQLFFDEAEDCNLTKQFTPHSENNKATGIPDKDGSLETPRSLSKQIVSIGLNGKQDMHFVEKDENLAVMNRDEKVKASSDCHEEHGFGLPGMEKSECNFSPVHGRKSPETSARSPRKRPSAIDEDILVDILPENSGTSKKETVRSLKKSATSNNSREKSFLNADLESGVRGHVGVVDMEEEQTGTLNSCEDAILEITEGASEFHFRPVVASVKMSNVSALSPRRGTSDICGNGVGAISSGENNSVKQGKDSFDHLMTSEVGNTSSLRSSLQGGADKDFLNLNMDLINAGLHETCTPKLDAGASGVSPENYCKPVNMSDAPEKSQIPDLNHVPQFSVCNAYEPSVRDQTDFVDEADMDDRSVRTHSVISESAQINNTGREIPYLLRSYIKHDKKDDFMGSDESPFGEKQVMNSVHSWPPCKRRKVDGRSSNMLNRFPRAVSIEPLKNTDESGILESRKNAKDGLMLDQNFNHADSSSDANAASSNVIERVDARLCQSASCQSESCRPLPQYEAKQGDLDVTVEEKSPKSLGLNQASVDPFLLSSLNIEECERVQDYQSELADISVIQLDSEVHPNLMISDDTLHLQITEGGLVGGSLQGTETVGREMLISYSPVMSPNFEDADPIDANQSMPELEGFDICLSTEKILPLSRDQLGLGNMDLPTTTCERIRALEKLCRSTSMLTPLPQLSSHKIQRKPDVSLPNGLLECMDMRKSVHFNDEGFDQEMETYMFEDSEPDLTSNHCSKAYIEFQGNWGVEKLPCTPPPVRFLDQITASTPTCHSYEKQKSLNPELTCFRIDEDTSTSEENCNLGEQTNIHGGLSPRDSYSSSCRRPLVDMTNSKTLPSISVSKNVYDRGSIDSVNTELYMHRTQISGKLNQGSSHGKGRRVKKTKESQSSSIGGNEIQKASGSRNKMNPKLLRKASEGNKSQSFLNNGSKRGNIVSNVSSFVPLVQQKQRPVAIAAGKRDVKVKALEAAEAAKRLEEKKEIDRKMKKEAAKLERARLEEEKKQLELKKKIKEEERKKKEAEKAARKRLREEEDKKEKEKKRACTEEARRQQNEQIKLGAHKEQRGQLFRPAVEKDGKKRDLRNEEKKHEKPKKGSQFSVCKKKIDTGTSMVNVAAESTKKASEVNENPKVFKEYHDEVEKRGIEKDQVNEERKHRESEKGSQLSECKKMIDTGTNIVSVAAENTKKESEVHENSEIFNEYHDEAVSNLCETDSYSFSFTGGTGEQSYEISPYQVSDDEEEEQDSVPNKKFIPSWAREKHLTSIMPSLQQMDPCKIFLPTRVCIISEMLLSRINSK